MELLTKLMLDAFGAAEHFIDCRHRKDFTKYLDALGNLELAVAAVKKQRAFLHEAETSHIPTPA
jgi:hypothetical protein